MKNTKLDDLKVLEVKLIQRPELKNVKGGANGIILIWDSVTEEWVTPV